MFIVAVTLISMATSELALYSLYLGFGDAAFGKSNVFYLAAIVPILVSLPICFVTGGMAMQLTNAHAQLKHLAHTDALTGLTNRRSFFASSDQVLSSAAENSDMLALLVIDADYFKQLNDTYGHATGDAALQFITEQLSSCVRRSDLVCRLGGEEFAVLLPGMSESLASTLADRILKKISTTPMYWDGKIIEMSVSCGIADTTVSYDMTALFKAADDALYAAKHDGRNRQVLYTSIKASSTSTERASSQI